MNGDYSGYGRDGQRKFVGSTPLLLDFNWLKKKPVGTIFFVIENKPTSLEPEMATAVAPPAPPATTYERASLLLVATLIIIFDHLTKLIIEAALPLYQSWTPFEALPFVRITHVSNTGAAFGIFPEAGLFFMIIAIIVTLFIVAYNYQLPGQHRLLRLALGLQLGGAIGNLIDRFRLGHVTDFVDIGPLAVFNVADAAIVCGVAALVVVMLRDEWGRYTAVNPQDSSEQRPLPPEQATTAE
jgi:signal peptidase II